MYCAVQCQIGSFMQYRAASLVRVRPVEQSLSDFSEPPFARLLHPSPINPNNRHLLTQYTSRLDAGSRPSGVNETAGATADPITEEDAFRDDFLAYARFLIFTGNSMNSGNST